MSQSLFQSGAVITKWNKVISNWGKLLFTGRANSYFKVEQLFQSGAKVISNWSNYFRVGHNTDKTQNYKSCESK